MVFFDLFGSLLALWVGLRYAVACFFFVDCVWGCIACFFRGVGVCFGVGCFSVFVLWFVAATFFQ